MSIIKYKFRSSISFEPLQLDEGRSSITVGELKANIIRLKNLNLSHGFDLVFSDPLTNLEYKEDGYRIPSGSSVIVKRVPAEMAPSTMAPVNFDDKLRIRDSKLAIPGSISLPVKEDLNDFGVDLCPVLKPATDHSLQFDKHNYTGIGTQKLESRNIGESYSRGADHLVPERKLQMPMELKGEERLKLEKMAGVHCPVLQNVSLPSELKCSLCNTYFKEAVMIPCCQNSFCQKCITTILIQKGTCPKCKSSKCKVVDLIPNLSLSRAIKQFLASKIRTSEEDKPLHRDASDGESGNQAKEYCSAVPIGQRDLKMPVSPSATEMGSNQINKVSGSRACNLGAFKVLDSALSSRKLRQVDGEKFAIAPDFQGETQPQDIIRQRSIPEEGGDKMYMGIRRRNKGDRTCYMCGSPDHFIRNCPLASDPPSMPPAENPMFPGPMQGYGSPFWNGTVAPMTPYTNMYGNFGMMHANPAMLPASPFAVPLYMPSMYGGPVPSGVMRRGDESSFAPGYQAGPRYRNHPLETLELQNSESRRRISNESLRSGRSYGDDGNEHLRTSEAEKLRKYQYHVEREPSESYSEDSFTQRSRKKNKEHHHRGSYKVHEIDRSDPRPCKQRSNPRVEDLSFSSDGRQAHDCKTSRDHNRKDQKRHKGNDPNCVSRQLRRGVNPTSRDLTNDRWQMASSSDEDHREEHHYHKRGRVQ